MTCPVCGSGTATRVAYPGRERAGALGFDSIEVCERCSLGVAAPCPSQATLDAFYAQGGYWHEVGDDAAASAHARNQGRHRARRVSAEMRLGRGIRVLDVGAGEAWTGDALATRAYDFVEPDARLRERAARRLGDRGRGFASLNDVGGGYDLVFVNQVLEHAAEPRAFLESVAARLAPRGLLYVEVPYADYRFKKDVFPHTLFFTPESLRGAAERAGLATLACESFGALPERQAAGARLAGRVALRLGAALRFAPLANAGDDLLFGYAPRADGIWLRWLGRRA